MLSSIARVFSKIPRSVKILLIAAVCAAVVLACYLHRTAPDDSGVRVTYSPIQASVSTIENSITGTGSVQPILSYDILALESGSIVSAPYEEGDAVYKGDLLYQIDDSDKLLAIEKEQNSLEQTRLSLEETKESLSDMTITAPMSGYVDDLNLKAGDKANGIIATVNDYTTANVSVDFYSWQVENMTVGQSVTVYNGTYSMSYTGTISRINPAPMQNSRGELITTVTILLSVDGPFSDPGGVFAEAANINTGTIYTSIDGSASVEMPSDQVSAPTSGTVTKVYVQNGDYVTEGQTLVQLDSTSLKNSISSKELSLKTQTLSLEEAESDLENFNITAPADGIVISKSYKEGDTVSSGNNGTTLMTIADMSRMVFTISVDELDISKIEVGQTVNVTADALDGVRFDAQVTAISITGTSSGGVTTYPVEVTIQNPDGLRIGMNVTAEIVVESAYDAVTVSSAAVLRQNGMSLVRVDFAQSDAPSSAAGYSATTHIDAALLEGLEVGDTFEADGFVFKRIETGISDGTNTQVIAGLSEEDTVLLSSAASTGSSVSSGGMGGMGSMGGMPSGGGMPGGGMPGGGMSGGGMPGGR